MEFDINPFASEEITPTYSQEWEAKRRVADGVTTASCEALFVQPRKGIYSLKNQENQENP